MSSKHIEPEKLTSVMMDMLAKYGDEVYEIVQDETKSIAREVASELRRTSPGDYARQWRRKPEKDGKTFYKETVYNGKGQLTHLLEKPHAVGPKKQGKYPAHKGSATDHTGEIAQVEEKYSQKYFNDMVKKL